MPRVDASVRRRRECTWYELEMPWLKRIDLLTGTVTRDELHVGTALTLERNRRRSNPMSLRQVTGAVRVFAESDSENWFCAPPAQPVQRLTHGSTLNAGECAYVFLEVPELREPALEDAACTSPSEARNWAAWLEANGDPYASPLQAMLDGRAFAGRERWWLEGCDRGMASVGATFEMRDGFLRRADLLNGTLPIDLQLLHLLTLRVARGLEHLTVDFAAFLPATFWEPFARSPFWETAPWPRSLQSLRLTRSDGKALEARRCAEVIGAKLPSIAIEP